MCQNNLLYFPVPKEKRLRDAVAKFSSSNAKICLDEFIKLLNEGVDESTLFLGALYEFGGNGVNKDYNKAKIYYDQASDLGYIEADYGLARMYYYGKGLKKDYQSAYSIYEKVAAQADDSFAYYMLGLMSLEGTGVVEDIESAEKMFKKAWKMGHVFSLTYLGKIENIKGNKVRSWLYRLKAGWIAFRLSGKNVYHRNLRQV